MPTTTHSEEIEYIFEDIQSKDFVHVCYLQRKAKRDDPQRFAEVKKTIKALENAAKTDREIFEELIADISRSNREAEKSFLGRYDYNTDYTNYRAQICKSIFTEEFSSNIEMIHSFSYDYSYDAIALTREESMDGYIEEIQRYLAFRKDPESFHTEFSERYSDWPACDAMRTTHLLTIFPNCTLLHPKYPFHITQDSEGLSINALPAADNFDLEIFLEEVLSQIFTLQFVKREEKEGVQASVERVIKHYLHEKNKTQGSQQPKDKNYDQKLWKKSVALHDPRTQFEKKWFEWLQSRHKAKRVGITGLLGRFLGIWMWDNKIRKGRTMEETAEDCQKHFWGDDKDSATGAQSSKSLDVLEGYYKWAARCIASGEVENAK